MVRVVRMSPIGLNHSSCVDRLNHWLVTSLNDRAVISIQSTKKLNFQNLFEPDVTVLRHREDFYAGKTPEPSDMLLLIEVADTSLRYDRQIKRPAYAKAGIAEHWLVDLNRHVIEVCRSPEGDQYTELHTVRGDDEVSPQAFADVIKAVSWITGQQPAPPQA